MVEEVVQAKMFSLLADETAGSLHTEQLRQSVFSMSAWRAQRKPFLVGDKEVEMWGWPHRQ